MASTNRTLRSPRQIGLASDAAPSEDKILDFVLSDFRDALAAYARISGTAVPRMQIFAGDDPGDTLPADTVILSSHVDTAEHALDAFSSLCTSIDTAETLIEEQRVYALFCLAGSRTAPDVLSHHCRALCDQHGFTWCGMLVIDNANALARHSGQPRLGFWRRPASEATDRLIGAVRAGLPISKAQQLAGAVIDPDDMIVAHARTLPFKR